MSKVVNYMNFEQGPTKPWESKLGGCPYLEKGDDGMPVVSVDPEEYGFICQINLSDLQGIDFLPSKGLLQVYSTSIEGDSEMIVRYIPTYVEDASRLANKSPYADFDLCEMEPVESRITFEFGTEEQGAEDPDYYDEDEDEDGVGPVEARCKIGGYCDDLGGAGDTEAGNVLQFKADDEAGIFLGDEGLGWLGLTDDKPIFKGDAPEEVKTDFFYACY